MKKLFAVTLSVVMILSLVACGTTTTKYVAKNATMLGYEVSIDTITDKECYISLSSDGNFEFAFEGETTTGTYTQSGNDITMTSNGESLAATLDGDTLTLDFSYDDDSLGTLSLEINFVKE